jgi:riboflavin-specific deaminase-like protein
VLPDVLETHLTDQSSPAWQAVLAACRLDPPAHPCRFDADGSGSLRRQDGDGAALLHWCPDLGWHAGEAAPPAQRDLLDLYLPICAAAPAGPLVVGHLGQSLDGFIATGTGDSCFVTGEANIVHLHRMRALCDAVVVGAGTAERDDPRLTTRKVAGPQPLRVVLDPDARLRASLGLFSDGRAPTLWVHGPEATPPATGAAVERLEVACHDGRLDLAQLCTALHRRGLRRLFVEGGGITVSAFLAAGALHRLQVAVAPVLIGNGRPGVQVAAARELAQAVRPAHRIYRLGDDLLFDLDLRASRARPVGGDGVVRVA